MKKLVYLPLLLVLLSLTSCDAVLKAAKAQQKKQNQGQNNGQNQGQNQTNTEFKKTNLKYGSDVRNTMNVILPKNSTGKTPFILLIHGGAWMKGDKNEVSFIQKFLAENGIASAAPNYRFASSSVHLPQMMDDIKKTVDYCKEHGSEWNVDNNQFIIGGASAGAHLALMYAYKYDLNNTINAVISLSGPTNLTDTKFIEHAKKIGFIDGVQGMVGANYTPNEKLAKNFSDVSPIYNIKNIPTLIIHGNVDKVVFYSQAVELDKALTNANYTPKFVTMDNCDHDLGVLNPINLNKVKIEMSNWIKKYDVNNKY